MARYRYTAEENSRLLREAEVLVSQGQSVLEACRQKVVTEQTYYRWRKEYGGLRVDQARRFKDLEREKARQKKLLTVPLSRWIIRYRSRSLALHLVCLTQSSLAHLSRRHSRPAR